MADVLLIWNNDDGVGDLGVRDFDLAPDPSLRTAVLVSLFTDRRVDGDDLPAGEFDRRGWWGDALAADNDQIGSTLWLLARSKQSNEVLVRTEESSREALAWMVEDGVARSVQVVAEWIGRGVLRLCVQIKLPSQETEEFQFRV